MKVSTKVKAGGESWVPPCDVIQPPPGAWVPPCTKV